MDREKWKKIKRSGGFKRKVKKTYHALQAPAFISVHNKATGQAESDEKESGSVPTLNTNDTNAVILSCNKSAGVEAIPRISFPEIEDSSSFSESEDNEHKEVTINENDEFREHYKKWAVDFNNPHVALKELNVILNKRIPCIVPLDPRTLLKSGKDIPIILVNDGYYWHNGLIETLKTILERLKDKPKCVSLNVNIDGLPLYNSSKHQVWPILCNIHERPNLSPFVVGIYEGTSKPSDLYTYFQPFVNELQELMREKLKIVSQEGVETFIEVKLRAFICDSPARALVKGVCNFNAKHGCLKCTVVGEYSHKSHTVTFAKTDCPRRNDADFRLKKYGDHHKHDSPLLELPIDMIEQFPVGDSLHLIDLGITKRLLFWLEGWKFRKSNYKMVCKYVSKSVPIFTLLSDAKGNTQECKRSQ